MSQENPLRSSGDLNFFVPAKTYGEAESCHATLLHYWVDLVVGDIPKVQEDSTETEPALLLKKNALAV